MKNNIPKPVSFARVDTQTEGLDHVKPKVCHIIKMNGGFHPNAPHNGFLYEASI